uniref:AMP-binding protein n=1 Tax=Cupriavidus yeoncheonensis TaxID=1462994 RepID=UPI003F495CAB
MSVAMCHGMKEGGVNITLNQFDLEQWRQTVEQQRVTHSFLVPTVLYRLLELQRANPRDFFSLNTVIYGAAPMSPARVKVDVASFMQPNAGFRRLA